MITELEAMNIEKANELMSQKVKDTMELWGTNE